jgi:hypothetical protein
MPVKWRTKRFLKSQTTDGLFVLLKVNPFYQLNNQITFGDLLKLKEEKNDAY